MMVNQEVNHLKKLFLGRSADGVDVMEQFNSSYQSSEIRSFHYYIRRVSFRFFDW